MSKPIVAVVGRPNVGKSTLFNALAGSRLSIVKDTPGITRDRIYAEVSWLDHDFTLIDTGGIEPESKDIILSQMREQAQIAIDTADVIIFMVDVKQGLQDADGKVADMLRRSKKPVILDITSTSCPPCLIMIPTLIGIAKNYPDIKIATVGIDEPGIDKIKATLPIRAFPTFFMVRDGKIINQLVTISFVFGDYEIENVDIVTDVFVPPELSDKREQLMDHVRAGLELQGFTCQ